MAALFFSIDHGVKVKAWAARDSRGWLDISITCNDCDINFDSRNPPLTPRKSLAINPSLALSLYMTGVVIKLYNSLKIALLARILLFVAKII